jgi:hypothetical protein
MKKVLLALLGVAFLCVMVADANACYKHGNSKWALHYAGEHNSKLNTCAFTMTDCREAPTGQLVSSGPMGPGRFDAYILALDTNGIAGTRYGLCCDIPSCFYFYGWTKCSDFEIPTAGWPACGGGNAQTWSVTQPAGHVTLGILDLYVYAGCGACLCMCDDPRKGFAEWCDGAVPEPWCCQISTTVYPAAFGCLCFGMPGYNPCGIIATETSSWGAVKAIYR